MSWAKGLGEALSGCGAGVLASSKGKSRDCARVQLFSAAPATLACAHCSTTMIPSSVPCLNTFLVSWMAFTFTCPCPQSTRLMLFVFGSFHHRCSGSAHCESTRAPCSHPLPEHHAHVLRFQLLSSPMFRFRTLRNYKDPMFLSARIVDKFIAGGIVMSLFHGLGGSTNIKEQTQLAGGCSKPGGRVRVQCLYHASWLGLGSTREGCTQDHDSEHIHKLTHPAWPSQPAPVSGQLDMF